MRSTQAYLARHRTSKSSLPPAGMQNDVLYSKRGRRCCLTFRPLSSSADPTNLVDDMSFILSMFILNHSVRMILSLTLSVVLGVN